MIELILGILATLVTAFGMGTLYFATFMFWSILIIKIAEKKGNIKIIAEKDNAENDKKEKT